MPDNEIESLRETLTYMRDELAFLEQFKAAADARASVAGDPHRAMYVNHASELEAPLATARKAVADVEALIRRLEATDGR
ncbi:hypothetical protein [Tsukamurella pulmonis]|uniref:hypothetical protein n=1 Tax=Tsukamurella pulmonis TaxID=47312 RepID=UPI000E09785F|nr:hypothetical protein [Tsukamurella pulmonis]RDH11549.1 hypothetical protein DVB88_12190 [Tsukamurella pulmonis]